MDRTRRTGALCAALCLICLLLAACGQPAEDSTSTPAPPASSEAPEPVASESESQPTEEELAALENVQKREEAQALLAPLYDLFAADDTDAVMELIAQPEYHALGDLLDGPEDNLVYTADAEPGAETKYLAVYSTPVAYEVTDNTTFYYFGQMADGQRTGEAYWVFRLADGVRISADTSVGSKRDPAADSYIGTLSFENDLPNGLYSATMEYPTSIIEDSATYVDALNDGARRTIVHDLEDAGSIDIWLEQNAMGKRLPYDDPPQYHENGSVILGRNEQNPSRTTYVSEAKTIEDLDDLPLFVTPGFHWMYPQA